MVIFKFSKKSNGLKLPEWAELNFDRIFESLKWGFYFDFRLTEMGKIK